MEKKAAVFLDRDGVLCPEKSYVTNIKELEIFPYTRECIEMIHKKGYLAICITNQSAVARGMLAEDVLIEMNQYLMGKVKLDAIYYCPHHPSGIQEYGIWCNCRKPGTGMLEKAIKEFNVDRSASYMVGDRASDILCGQKAGMETILLESGFGTKFLEYEVNPEQIYKDLRAFLAHLPSYGDKSGGWRRR